MPKLWTSPIYKLQSAAGKEVTIDVTTSVSPGLEPHGAIREKVIPVFRDRGVSSVVDFGAGALRHCFPLLKARFQVCAVEFRETFQPNREVAFKNLARAKKSRNFSALIWPDEFLEDERTFDAALLCYVLQVMPKPRERPIALKELANRIRRDGFLVYMSRYNQWLGEDRYHGVEDGAYRYPKRDEHSFYTEWNAADTHKMFKKYGLQHVKSLSERGTDQFFVYVKGNGTWP